MKKKVNFYIRLEIPQYTGNTEFLWWYIIVRHFLIPRILDTIIMNML